MNLSTKAPIRVELSTDLHCCLRPVTKHDRFRAKAAYQHLSKASRESRFWQASQQLSDDLAIRLADTNSEDHRSWIALPLQEDPQLPGYGAASFWRDPNSPKMAEFSVTVLDKWQRHGFGALLLAALWWDAWQLGIREFTGIARTGRADITSWWLSAGGIVTPENQFLSLSLPLEDPAKFVQKRSYDLHLRSVEADLAHWFKTWLKD